MLASRLSRRRKEFRELEVTGKYLRSHRVLSYRATLVLFHPSSILPVRQDVL